MPEDNKTKEEDTTNEAGNHNTAEADDDTKDDTIQDISLTNITI